MSGRWCPRCGAEYVEGWGTCSTCDVELVAERPAVPVRDPEPVIASREPRDDSDPFVPVWEGPTTRGLDLLRRLEAASIPCDTDEALEAGRLRLQVPRSYLAEAQLALQTEAPAPTGMDDDDDEPVADTGWSPAVRIAILVIALLLVAVLLLSGV
jgi:hypothetical protein